PIKFKGVNRHEHDPDEGHVVSEASMRKDILRMKELNINAVRTFYPNHPRWYELCNEYGLYVVDEPNIDCDPNVELIEGLTISNRGEWKKAFIQRMMRMVDRDKNQPSILIWGLGNGPGDGQNFESDYSLVKLFDPTRPVLFEMAGPKQSTDFQCLNFPSLRSLVKTGNEKTSRPVLLTHYGKASGDSVLLFEAQWKQIDSIPSLAGGFLNLWSDQRMRRYRNGEMVFTYETEDPKQQPVLLENAVVNPDREGNPQATAIKNGYSPVQMEAQMTEKFVSVRLKNRFSFRDFSGLKGKVSWYLDGKLLKTEPFKIKSIIPGESLVLYLPMPSEISKAEPISKGVLLDVIQEKENSILPALHVITSKAMGLVPAPLPSPTEKK
ncbi:MAG TPA: glycoside hydrolase family 2 TIM barrel-domain containing protein, partial [Catalimonadaceae bacterium]|nr:glycoside hydrolase family 2 TIM barrel-domain containing protein [Catalimonadaceae bacterium]